jgi:hypothetical protein
MLAFTMLCPEINRLSLPLENADAGRPLMQEEQKAWLNVVADRPGVVPLFPSFDPSASPLQYALLPYCPVGNVQYQARIATSN